MAHRLENADDHERRHSSNEDSCDGSDGDSSDAAGHGGFDRRRYVRFAATAFAAIGALRGGTIAPKRASATLADDRDAVRQLTIDSRGGVTRYELTVDGELGPGPGSSRDAHARISGGSTEGVVDDDVRSYRFGGEIRDLVVDGDALIYVESERISPDRL